MQRCGAEQAHRTPILPWLVVTPALQHQQFQLERSGEGSPAAELNHRVAHHRQAAPDAGQRVCHAGEVAAGKVVIHPLE